MLDRLFLLPQGLPGGRDQYKHAIITPSTFNNYGSKTFPALTDLLYGYDDLEEGEVKDQRTRELQKHVSDLTTMILASADFLAT